MRVYRRNTRSTRRVWGRIRSVHFKELEYSLSERLRSPNGLHRENQDLMLILKEVGQLFDAARNPRWNKFRANSSQHRWRQDPDCLGAISRQDIAPSAPQSLNS